MNLLTQGLSTQRMIVDASKVTDEYAAKVKEANLRLVHRPDPVKSNVVSLDDRRMQMCVSPEAA